MKSTAGGGKKEKQSSVKRTSPESNIHARPCSASPHKDPGEPKQAGAGRLPMPPIQEIDEKLLVLNDGNPRSISGKNFERLVKSLKESPEMFRARPVLVSDRTGKLIVIGGNMRLRAARKIGMNVVPTIVLSGLTKEKEKEIQIKDNGSFGEWDWDALANEWDGLPLADWTGLDIPSFEPIPSGNKEINDGGLSETKNECPKCGFKW